MLPPRYERPWGIYDTETGEWQTDCFDYVREFKDREAAEWYRSNCVTYATPRYEVRPIVS